jgi:hypothetical protein
VNRPSGRSFALTGAAVGLTACLTGIWVGGASSSPAPPVIGCAIAVQGPVNARAPGTLVAGPVAWPALRNITPRNASKYRPHQGLARFVKLLLLVKHGAPTTLTIPAKQRSRLALYYGNYVAPRSTWHGVSWYRLSDGQSALTFQPCPQTQTGRTWTQFAGGLIIKGAQCATINISRGSSRQLHPRLPLGKHCS